MDYHLSSYLCRCLCLLSVCVVFTSLSESSLSRQLLRGGFWAYVYLFTFYFIFLLVRSLYLPLSNGFCMQTRPDSIFVKGERWILTGVTLCFCFICPLLDFVCNLAPWVSIVSVCRHIGEDWKEGSLNGGLSSVLDVISYSFGFDEIWIYYWNNVLCRTYSKMICLWSLRVLDGNGLPVLKRGFDIS